MQYRGFLIAITAVISALCLYYLSFTFISRGIDDEAISFATDAKTGKVDGNKKQAYLDSLWTSPVVDLGVFQLTYKDVKTQEVKLGLDLLGGMNVTMEVSASDILNILSNNSKNAVYQRSLQEAMAEAPNSRKPFVDLFYEKFKANANGVSLAQVFSNKNNRERINLGSTDAQVLKYLNDEVNGTIDRSFEILRTRIDKFGVTQPNIQRLAGTNRIQIELPGVDNPARVRKLLQGAAKLEFYEVMDSQELGIGLQQMNDLLVKEERAAKSGMKGGLMSDVEAAGQDTTKPAATPDSAATAKADTSKKDTAAKATAKKDSTNSKQSTLLASLFVNVQGAQDPMVRTKDTAKVNRLFARAEIKALFPSNMKAMWDVKSMEAGTNGDLLALYFVRTERDGEGQLSGDVLTEARQDFDQGGQPEVNMQMNAKGAQKWRKLTAASIGRRIAISLDDRVYSAPVVRGEIPNGNSSISGSFTIDEAKDLANVLKAGRMPVPTRIVEEAVVGPTLGAESIQKGLMSIFAGFLVIIAFMIIYYGTSGAIADLAVLLNVFLILGILVPVGAVLTLPGIAGIVLTIGMAVDANVLINERVKDELRAGLPLAGAIDSGYRLASTSIWDANITTMIAGVVLFFLGAGVVQGFATTLIIGIITSLFTSIYITRVLSQGRLNMGKEISFVTSFSKNLFKQFNVDFISKRRVAYIGSSIFLTFGLVWILTSGFNLGVDFKGGYTYTIGLDKEVSTDQVRDALKNSLGGVAPEVKTYGGGDKVKVTTTYLIDDQGTEAADKVEAAVKDGLSKLSGVNATVLSSSKVGPTVATDLRYKSILAVVVAMLGIFAYITIRFRKWQYALGAIIAVFHDTLFIMVMFSLLKDVMPFSMDIDQNFIAALLTIVGYSVNDTVVIFDRIREQLRENPDEAPSKIINGALNFTFSRTIITASTVFLVCLILLIFGGETVKGMSFALILGVLTGTYSTIYIAVPFVIDASKDELAKARA